MIKHCLCSCRALKLVGKLSSTDSNAVKVAEQSASGGARHPSFVPFLSMPWVRSHPMTARCAISWISTYALIPPHYLQLIQSRNRDFGSQSSDRPSLLLVAQPDPSLPTVRGEIQVVQTLDAEVTSLISEAGDHPPRSSIGFQSPPICSLLGVMVHWRLENH
ncbi:hypothetical protein BJY52DRAFT_1194549 [Lactarius psammicola]|nr:hypothetical protein BJY52DRAFT_1194549 [Lactarius psammicola]